MSKEPALYNLENLTAFYDSDKNLANQIIKLFIENIPQYSSELTEASKINNWQSVAFTAHKLKSNIKLFNINSILDDIIQIEVNAKSLSNLELLPEKIDKVVKALQEVEKEMIKAITA